jgi:hypothetical protein
MDKKGYLDIVQQKLTSRKLLIMIVSTILIGFGKISGDEWTAIALGYVGVEGLADIATRWKFGAKE